MLLSCEEDLQFLHVLEVTEEEFQCLKADQGILVDFGHFPGKIISLLQRCIECRDAETPRWNLLETPIQPSKSALFLFDVQHQCMKGREESSKLQNAAAEMLISAGFRQSSRHVAQTQSSRLLRPMTLNSLLTLPWPFVQAQTWPSNRRATCCPAGSLHIRRPRDSATTIFTPLCRKCHEMHRRCAEADCVLSAVPGIPAI